MSVIKSFFFCFSLVLVTVTQVIGQAAKSPYSTYGIGESYGFELAHNQGMGGLGLSQPQYWYLNNQNPALLTYNYLTVFQAGIIGESLNLTNGPTNERLVGGNMNYLAAAFPIKYNRATTSVGLMPYSNVNYEYNYEQQAENSNDTVRWKDSGTGGLTQVYWATGFRIFKGFSVGVRAGYVFGAIAHNVYGDASVDDQVVPIIYGSERKTYSRGFLLSGGLSYSKDSLFNSNYRLNLGVVYDLSSSLSSRLNEHLFLIDGTRKDTVSIEPTKKGTLELPSAFGAGISFGRERKWSVGVDFSAKDWNEYKSMLSNGYEPGKSWKIAVGGELTPDYLSNVYFKRVTYRAGVSQAPFFANGKKVNDFGINFGLSFPTGGSSIDLSVKTGRRGDVAENGIKENYFKIYLGVTLNEQWFIKRKFD